MKGKIIGALLMVMAIAGTAAAYQPCGEAPRHRGYRDGRPELSQEERAQFETMRNLRGEIRAELGKEKPDKAKARKLFEKSLILERNSPRRVSTTVSPTTARTIIAAGAVSAAGTKTSAGKTTARGVSFARR